MPKLTKTGMVALVVGGVTVAFAVTLSLQGALNGLVMSPGPTTYSTQGALNILVQGHADSLTKYSTQAAANRLLNYGAKLAIPPAHTNTSGVRVNGGWATLNTSTTTPNAALSIGTADSIRHWFVQSHTSRINRTVQLDSIKIHLLQGTESNYDRVHVEFWHRRVGARYDRKAQTGNILTGTGAGTRTWIPATPFTIELGWYPVLFARKTAGIAAGSILVATSDANAILNNIAAVHPADVSYTWRSQTSQGAFRVEVECYTSELPQVIVDGFSQMAGSDLTNTYAADLSAAVDSNSATDRSLITTHWDYVMFHTIRPGISWENAAVGGATSSGIMTRASRNVFARQPRVAMIQMGGNDTDSSSVYNNMEAYLDSCQARGIIPIVVGLAPMTNKTNAEWFRYDRMNTALQTLCSRHPSKPTFVLLQGALGLNRSTGTPTPPIGNLWDIIVAYNSGGLHYTAAGQAAWAAKVDSSLTWDFTRP